MKSHFNLVLLALFVCISQAAWSETVAISASITEIDTQGNRDTTVFPKWTVPSGVQGTAEIVQAIIVPLADLTQEPRVAVRRLGGKITVSDASGMDVPKSDAAREIAEIHAMEIPIGVILEVTPAVKDDEIMYRGKLRIIEAEERVGKSGHWNFLESSTHFYKGPKDGTSKTLRLKASTGKIVEVALNFSIDESDIEKG